MRLDDQLKREARIYDEEDYRRPVPERAFSEQITASALAFKVLENESKRLAAERERNSQRLKTCAKLRRK